MHHRCWEKEKKRKEKKRKEKKRKEKKRKEKKRKEKKKKRKDYAFRRQFNEKPSINRCWAFCVELGSVLSEVNGQNDTIYSHNVIVS